MQYESPVGGSDLSSYVDPNPGAGTDGSLVRAPAIENHQRELTHLIAYAGLTPNRGDLEQVRKAIEALIAGGGQTILQGDLTYHVSPTGSDANNGLTLGTAFATFGKALQNTLRLQQNGYTVTIQAAPGTYTEDIAIDRAFTGNVFILGDLATPSNCVLNVTSNGLLMTGSSTRLTFKGFRLVGGSYHINLQYGASGFFGNLEFGTTAAAHIFLYQLTAAIFTTGYTISGSTQHHILMSYNSTFFQANVTNVVTGTPNWSVAFVDNRHTSSAQMTNITYSGSATGKKHIVAGNAVINTNGAGTSHFPGNIAGTDDGFGCVV